MPGPLIVLDQNVLREEPILDEALDRVRPRGGFVVLTDSGLAETLKPPEWDDTFRKNMRLLAREPDRVVVAHGIGPMMRMEMETGSPIVDVIDRPSTDAFRNILMDVGTNGPHYQRARLQMPRLRAMVEEQRLGHGRNRERVVSAEKVWHEVLDDNDRKRLRGGDADYRRELLDNPALLELLDRSLAELMPPEVAKRLTYGPSVTARIHLADFALALFWLGAGGLEGAAPEKLTNDAFDMEYVVLASFCEDLLTLEKKMKALRADLQAVLLVHAQRREAGAGQAGTTSNASTS